MAHGSLFRHRFQYSGNSAAAGAAGRETKHGAEDGNNLESLSAVYLLEELENWAVVLKGEPEVIQRLAAFAAVAADEGDDCQDQAANELPMMPLGFEP